MVYNIEGAMHPEARQYIRLREKVQLQNVYGSLLFNVFYIN